MYLTYNETSIFIDYALMGRPLHYVTRALVRASTSWTGILRSRPDLALSNLPSYKWEESVRRGRLPTKVDPTIVNDIIKRTDCQKADKYHDDIEKLVFNIRCEEAARLVDIDYDERPVAIVVDAEGANSTQRLLRVYPDLKVHIANTDVPVVDDIYNTLSRIGLSDVDVTHGLFHDKVVELHTNRQQAHVVIMDLCCTFDSNATDRSNKRAPRDTLELLVDRYTPVLKPGGVLAVTFSWRGDCSRDKRVELTDEAIRGIATHNSWTLQMIGEPLKDLPMYIDDVHPKTGHTITHVFTRTRKTVFSILYKLLRRE